jgi:hypothetical protein
MHGHHIFVQAEDFAQMWRKAGIDIDEFRVQLSEGTHLTQLHGKGDIPEAIGRGGLWNETWRQYFVEEAMAGRAITQDELFLQAGKMLGDFAVPYYSPLSRWAQ